MKWFRQIKEVFRIVRRAFKIDIVASLLLLLSGAGLVIIVCAFILSVLAAFLNGSGVMLAPSEKGLYIFLIFLGGLMLFFECAPRFTSRIQKLEKKQTAKICSLISK